MSEVGAAGLSIHQLSWRPHGRLRPTLQGVNLELRRGERVLLVGASGSGKSTLLRAMAGLLDDSVGEQGGQVRLGGGPPGRRAGQVGLMLQEPMHTIVAEYAGRDVAFGPENAQQPPPVIRERAAATLVAVHFPYSASHRSTELSGGQMQRLSLAGTLALDPDLLLLDEPTAMLDDRAGATVREAVRLAADQRGLTLVVVEHRLDGWLEICDRMVVLGPGGTVLADGPVHQVLRDQRDDLAAAGVWVPGEPAPVPLAPDWHDQGDWHDQTDWHNRSDWHDRTGLNDRAERTDRAERGDLTRRHRDATPAVPGSAAALQVKALSLAAPGREGRSRMLMRDLHISLAAGEALAVMGRSGSGKSTLLRTVAGFHPPIAGQVLLSGRPAEQLVREPRSLAAAVAWLPQHPDHLITDRSLYAEVMATSVKLYADRPALLEAARSRAERILVALGLWHLRDADPYQLSVGEQRRMGLAAVVLHSPRLLLLDEPTVGQDRHTWSAVVGVVRAIQAEGGAVLAATHDHLLADALDRTAWLTDDELPETSETSPDYEITEVIEPGGTPAARCNPMALLSIALGAAVGSFFIRDWEVGAFVLLLVAVLAPLAVRPSRSVFLRLIPVALAALTVGWSALVFSERGPFAPTAWPVAGREVLRICYLVVPGVLLVPSLPPSRLSDALAQRARLPHRPVVVASAALLRVQQVLDTWRQLAETRTIRGLHPGRSFPQRVRHVAALTFALLVWTFRSSQQMAVSMDARGFGGARRRTFALPSLWRPRDWICLAVAVLLLAAPIVLTSLHW